MVRYRHKKRGTTYRVLTLAELQTSVVLAEGAVLVIYEGADGRVWARPRSEFYDGRFEAIREDA